MTLVSFKDILMNCISTDNRTNAETTLRYGFAIYLPLVLLSLLHNLLQKDFFFLYLLSSSIYLSFFLSFLMQLAIREGKNHRQTRLIP